MYLIRDYYPESWRTPKTQQQQKIPKWTKDFNK